MKKILTVILMMLVLAGVTFAEGIPNHSSDDLWIDIPNEPGLNIYKSDSQMKELTLKLIYFNLYEDREYCDYMITSIDNQIFSIILIKKKVKGLEDKGYLQPGVKIIFKGELGSYGRARGWDKLLK